MAADGRAMTLPQGDLGLLETDVARRLLASTLPARLAYTGRDGAPRVVPIWFQWTGDELVMGSLPGAAKVPALRAKPDVAITIDTESFPPDVLLVRGRATVADVEGIVPEYAQAARRYMGEGPAADYLGQLDRPGARMYRIAVRPAWAAVLDFQTRFPGVLGGVRT
jgi:hypothetical protein